MIKLVYTSRRSPFIFSQHKPCVPLWNKRYYKDIKSSFKDLETWKQPETFSCPYDITKLSQNGSVLKVHPKEQLTHETYKSLWRSVVIDTEFLKVITRVSRTHPWSNYNFHLFVLESRQGSIQTEDRRNGNYQLSDKRRTLWLPNNLSRDGKFFSPSTNPPKIWLRF